MERKALAELPLEAPPELLPGGEATQPEVPDAPVAPLDDELAEEVEAEA